MRRNYSGALPDSCYQLASLDATIPANAQQMDIPITLFPDKIKGTQNYLIAYTISSADKQTIASNTKSIVFTLSAQ